MPSLLGDGDKGFKIVYCKEIWGVAPAQYCNWGEWGLKEYKWKRFVRCAGTRVFYPALAALVSLVQNIFSSPYTISIYVSPKRSNLGWRSWRAACLWKCISGIQWGKIYFLLGQLEQPRRNKNPSFQHEKPANQQRKDPFRVYSLSPHSPQFQKSAVATSLWSFCCTLFQSFVPIAQQAGQAAVLGRLSLSMCFWWESSKLHSHSRGHPSMVSLILTIFQLSNMQVDSKQYLFWKG